jgi:HEAT repeat protein
VAHYPLDAPQSDALTKEVLARWFRPELAPSSPVFRAIEHLGSRSDLASGAVLEQALLHPVYAGQAIESMAALRNPVYLEKIARGLAAEWVGAGGDRLDVQRQAARALASFNEPAAAEFLLRGLQSGDPEVRGYCKAGLERLEEYEKHARAWKDRGMAAPSKESALADLLTMLGDKDPVLRAQAALGLATLGAVETLPQLIRLLKDSDANVRAAALNALPVPAGGG